MKNVLNNWQKDWTLMPYFFDESEIKQISTRIRNLKIENVVYCSYESRFAISGGLAMVTMKLPAYLKMVNHIPSVILITPFHSNIIDEATLKSTGLKFDVVFDQKKVIVEILEHVHHFHEPEEGNLTEYFLKADGFFNARNRLNDPYLYIENDISKNDEMIRDNALFFCKAVPLAIKKLKRQKNIIFHLQEWQTSLVSLTSKEAMLNGTIHSCGAVVTLHNPFDSFIPYSSLAKIVDEQRIRKIANHFKDGLTAYQIGLQLVDAPITTVSENFAREFTTDILQTEHFVPHLQQIFQRTGLFGISNGLFHDFPAEFSKEKDLTIGRIKQAKLKFRKALLKVLADYNPPERFGELTYRGRSILNLPDAIPIFLMSGRLDFNQKGFDIFLQVIERFPEDEIKVVLTPMPVIPAHLDYFRDIAAKCKGNLTIFPIKMQHGYYELQIGSTFGVMPSIYEPFGAAIEYMVKGTVTVARRTGGLVDQIDHEQCGFLFREDSRFYNLDNIKQFFKLSDQVIRRRDNGWVQSMIDHLHETIRNAINLYQNHPHEYLRLIIMGFRKARSFDWSVSAKKYFEVYEQVKQGF
jgi:glycogen synthase